MANDIKIINGIRTIKCSCGARHLLARGDSVCANCEAEYNAGGDRLRSRHCSDEHYEAAEYAEG